MAEKRALKYKAGHIGLALLVVFIFTLMVLAAAYEEHIFSFLKNSTTQLHDLALQNPILFVLGYAALYISLVVALVPADSAMMTVAGISFGFIEGGVLACTLHTIGTTITFMLSRAMFKRRHAATLKEARDELPALPPKKGNMWVYLFVLRMMPFVPTPGLTIVIAGTRISYFGFVSATWLGTLPFSLFFAYIGTKIAHVDSAADLLTLDMLLALACFVGVVVGMHFIWRFSGHFWGQQKEPSNSLKE